MNWLSARLRERTSQAALSTLVGAIAIALQGGTDWHAVIPVAVSALLTVLVPEGQGGAATTIENPPPAGQASAAQ